MPIIFEDLESILFEWKQHLKMKTPRESTGVFVYKVYKNNIDNIFINKIKSLFKTVDIKKVEIKETENDKERKIIFKKNNSKL
tara:strand:- start:13184 stop:13432 length:249 start_codon:yes stop_codon:yes gene_type:complete